MDLKGKRVCVCGMARSGVSSARLAKDSGADVTVCDTKEYAALKEEAALLDAYGIKTVCGKNPDEELLDKADIIILSPVLPLGLPFIKKTGERGITVLPEIEFASMFCEAEIAAITGTNGKTTTAALTGEIMKRVNPASMTLGNIGTAFSAHCRDIPKGAFAVLEVSSFQLEAAAGFKPRAAAIVQITPEHLDRHKTMENYISVKAGIFKNQTEDDYAILNYDDKACVQISRAVKSKVIFFSQKEVLDGGIYLDGSRIISDATGNREYVLDIEKLKIPGRHNVENVMAAIGIAGALGVPADIVRETAQGFAGVPHRIEFVRDLAGVKFYNDSKATNPDSAVKGLLAMSGKTVLIGGGYDKNADFGEWVRLFESGLRHFIVFGETADKIIESCREHNFSRFSRVNSLGEAVRLALCSARAGDSVLLSPACASWDMFRDFEQRGDMFRDLVNGL